MQCNKKTIRVQGTTSLFVLLWGSAAIFTRWGLDNASPIVLLLFRFSIAFVIFLIIAIFRKRILPQKGTTTSVIMTGVILISGYSVCYFNAMSNGVTPGLIATIMGIQPILTLCLIEKHMQTTKVIGLVIALTGLTLLVWQSVSISLFSPIGICFALGALLCMTFGAILQQKLHQSPMDTLPIQYFVSLLFCLLFLPFETIEITINYRFIISVLFLGVLISTVAQIVLYQLLNKGNIVNVTSLFYLVPVVTAFLDFILLGNKLPLAGGVGMLFILIGLVLVFRKKES